MAVTIQATPVQKMMNKQKSPVIKIPPVTVPDDPKRRFLS